MKNSPKKYPNGSCKKNKHELTKSSQEALIPCYKNREEDIYKNRIERNFLYFIYSVCVFIYKSI